MLPAAKYVRYEEMSHLKIASPYPVSPVILPLFVVHLLLALLGCSGQMRIANRCGIVSQSR